MYVMKKIRNDEKDNTNNGILADGLATDGN